jgi:hypothetical protein
VTDASSADGAQAARTLPSRPNKKGPGNVVPAGAKPRPRRSTAQVIADAAAEQSARDDDERITQEAVDSLAALEAEEEEEDTLALATRVLHVDDVEVAGDGEQQADEDAEMSEAHAAHQHEDELSDIETRPHDLEEDAALPLPADGKKRKPKSGGSKPAAKEASGKKPAATKKVSTTIMCSWQ